MRALINGSVKLALSFCVTYAVLMIALSSARINGVGLIYRANSFMKLKTMGSWSRFQEHDPEDRYDVIVVGSSHAYRGYDPRIFESRGYSMFNLGGPAQTFINTWPIVSSYIDRSNTGLLILDVYSGVFRGDGKESAVDLIPNVDDDLLSADIAWRIGDPRAIDLLVMRLLNKEFRPFRNSESYIRNGYSSTTDSVKGVPRYWKDRAFEYTDWQLCHFDRIIEHCDRLGVNLVLVTHPMPKASDVKGQLELAEFLSNYLGDQGPLYLDFSMEADFNDHDHFFDHNHLNQAGVDLFVPRLIDSLEARGLLHRSVN